MVAVCKKYEIDKREMRKVYIDTLIQTAQNNPNIIVINCDLTSSMGTGSFAKTFPERSFNMGIQEANACGVAAGLSVMDYIPFFHSFAVFSTRRIFDQVFLSCAYSKLNVKLVGGDPGVTAAVNGGTHMPFEDLGIMRTIPGVTLVEPSDPVMMSNIIPKISQHYGVDYIRMARKKVPRIYEEGSDFTIGKAVVLREGTDVSLIASGICVYEALKAADSLAEEGIRARVVDMFTIKPIDSECIIDCAERTKAIVTVENHNIINGLGSAVSEVLSENDPVPMERVGVMDCFGEVGSQEFLMDRFNLTEETICKKAKRVIQRKNKIRSVV
jgi:transketolase